MAGAGISSGGGGVGTTVEVSEIESLSDGHIIIGDGSGAPTTRAAYSSSTGAHLAPVGAAATPGYAFTGLATTGIYTGDGLIRMTLGGTLGLHFGDSIIYFGATADVAAYRNAAGVLEVNNGTAGTFASLLAADIRQGGANGQRATIQHATASATVTAGATHLFANLVPAGSVILGVTVRNTTAVGTGDAATGYSVGDGSDVDRWGANIALTANTTTTLANQTISALPVYAAALSVTLTAVAGTFDGTGTVRVTAHYISLTAATS